MHVRGVGGGVSDSEGVGKGGVKEGRREYVQTTSHIMCSHIPTQVHVVGPKVFSLTTPSCRYTSW